jgi:hypothetical protein
MRDIVAACLKPNPALAVTHAASGLEAGRARGARPVRGDARRPPGQAVTSVIIQEVRMLRAHYFPLLVLLFASACADSSTAQPVTPAVEGPADGSSSVASVPSGGIAGPGNIGRDLSSADAGRTSDTSP